MNKLYLAGQMTGIPQFNFPAFHEAARTLRSLGIEVISPAEIDDPETATLAMKSVTGKLGDASPHGQTWGDFLARDVKIVADQVDGVALLKNWERSKGAKLEVTVALLAGKDVYAYHEGAGVTPLSREWVKDVLYANL
jgi:Domain of unknown function (DUF4406)